VDDTAPCVAVAVSGGRDSLALLHATLGQARSLGLRVAALHVHHGLLPEADGWLQVLHAWCQRQQASGAPLRLLHRRLTGRPAAGESVEAWARKGRYRALAEMAREAGADLVLLGHHRRDQAETFLLQALRGGGAAGLAAMPRAAQRAGLTWARPWLQQPRRRIEAYVAAHGLEPVDDPSNEDPAYARNRLRVAAWPALATAFPDVESVLAAAAERARLEAACLQELADLDLRAVAPSDGLALGPWSGLSEGRRYNVLRAWLRRELGQGAEESLLRRLMAELVSGAGPARWPLRSGVELRRYRGVLTWTRCVPREVALHREQALCIRAFGDMLLPDWNGVLRVEPAVGEGVPLQRLANLVARERRGSEQFQTHAGGVARSLKKQYQAAGLPEWHRNGPLLYCEGGLIFVPGLGLDARARVKDGSNLASLTWIPGAGNPVAAP
jgi:tRNA(Ile)-lysidine synthase